ncbi:MAG: FtsX-like permease family protein [Verrucomicrobia bacterium]|nr:MAG: FtsX-like permease family protein [Verrucomicrobiota bacterium]
MTALNASRIALHALGRNKLRSALTALGIIIGVGSLIALLAIGHGARAEVEKQVASLGENVIQVSAGSITKSAAKLGLGSSGALTVEDAEALKEEIPDAIAVSPEVKIKTQVVAGNRNWSTEIYGNSPEYFRIRQWATSAGEIFTEQDVRGATKVAVIGQMAADQLFDEDEDPIGELIRIRGVPFKVVGVLAVKGASASGSDQDDSIIIPHTTAIRHLIGKQTGLRRIYVQAASLDVLPTVEKKVGELLRQRHHIETGSDDDFKVRSQLEIAESATATARTMTVLLSLIAGVSLVVGGIGIMNIMLVSVTERTREIGIRMAIGAHRRDIMRQFLIEAVTLSALGGVIGIACGTGAAKMLATLAQWPTLISPDAVLIAFVFSAVVGIFFGYYPARKASRLDPIEALRYE